MSKKQEKLPPIGSIVQWISDGQLALVVRHDNKYSASLKSLNGRNASWAYELPRPYSNAEYNWNRWQIFEGKR